MMETASKLTSVREMIVKIIRQEHDKAEGGDMRRSIGRLAKIGSLRIESPMRIGSTRVSINRNTLNFLGANQAVFIRAGKGRTDRANDRIYLEDYEGG